MPGYRATGAWHRDALRSGQAPLWFALNVSARELAQGDDYVARLAAAFGAQVLVHTRSPVQGSEAVQPATSLEDLLKRADIVSLHCALNSRTRDLLNAERLGLMKPGALLLTNSSAIDTDVTAARKHAVPDALNQLNSNTAA